ncbi:hypothetical protein MRX96_015932 [Rhipicephalus microplus]
MILPAKVEPTTLVGVGGSTGSRRLAARPPPHACPLTLLFLSSILSSNKRRDKLGMDQPTGLVGDKEKQPTYEQGLKALGNGLTHRQPELAFGHLYLFVDIVLSLASRSSWERRIDGASPYDDHLNRPRGAGYSNATRP